MVTSVAFSPVSMLDETKPYAKKSFSPWAAKRPVENAGELVLQSLFSSESKKKKNTLQLSIHNSFPQAFLRHLTELFITVNIEFLVTKHHQNRFSSNDFCFMKL